MIRNLRPFLLFVILALPLPFFLLAPSVAHAAGTIKIDDTHSLSIGIGLRTSFNAIQGDAPDGTSRSKDFLLDSIRLYTSGQFHEKIFFEFNTERDAAETIHVMDAVVKFGFSDYVNIWFGRFLPPSDRSNLSGPYYLNSWDYPLVALGYPAIFAGRDDGAAVWGQIGGGRFKYQVGAFQGEGATATGPNQKQDLLYAGRLTLNVWDPEPGYYNSSTYYGSKNVLALGLVGMAQKNAVGTTATPGDFKGWNVDLLAERNLGAIGVPTLEGAYYNYDNKSLAPEGKGYFVLVSYLIPGKIGAGGIDGQIQPLVRYQSFKNKGATGTEKRYDIGLSYIIDGHNARITANYFSDDPAPAGVKKFNGFQLGLQFQL